MISGCWCIVFAVITPNKQTNKTTKTIKKLLFFKSSFQCVSNNSNNTNFSYWMRDIKTAGFTGHNK